MHLASPWLFLALLTAFPAAGQSTPAPSLSVKATGAALQGDVRGALRVFSDATEPLSEEDIGFRNCLTDRFEADAKGAGAANRADDPLVDAVLNAYRTYWRNALLDNSQMEPAEANLLHTLNGLLRATYGSMDELEAPLKARLEAAGLHSLQGTTGPLRELMIWTRQSDAVRTVSLPEGDHPVRVILLDDFLSLGWTDYATCGRRGAGGWATTEALYGVVPRYRSLEGEEFRVTFLAHEAQHFADLSRFEDLEAWELEYRAKLVELAQVDETRERVLRKFAEDQSDDPTRPHGYANRRLLVDMVRRIGLAGPGELFSVEIARLNTAAREALEADTARLEARSAR